MLTKMKLKKRVWIPLAILAALLLGSVNTATAPAATPIPAVIAQPLKCIFCRLLSKLLCPEVKNIVQEKLSVFALLKKCDII